MLTQEAYLETGGAECPHCGAGDIEETEQIQGCGDSAHCRVRCNKCLKVWVDVYALTGFEPQGD